MHVCIHQISSCDPVEDHQRLFGFEKYTQLEAQADLIYPYDPA